MLTRAIQGKRPRRPVGLVLGTAAAAAALYAAIALAALVSDTGSYSVEVPDKDHSSGLVDIGNASVEYIGSSADNQASGTGLFDPFVRLQGSPTEKGYNTDGTVAFDTKSGIWTKAIKVNAIPVVDCDGSGGGTATCWELFVDINDSNTAKYISLNEVEIWFTTDPNLVGYLDPTGFPSGATQEYDFTGEIKIHDVNQGSGRGDLRYLVPTAGHTWDATTYFVLYSKWGTSAGAAPDGKTYSSEGGFEEWKVRKTPNVTIVKTANPVGPVSAGSNIGFDITVSNTGVADATDVVITDPLPAGLGNDLNWSLDPAFPGCSITGAIGSQTLTCTFATLAAGTSIGPIHVTSDTTQADCAVVNNTGTVTSGNDGGGSSSASVTVQCAAIKILKQSTKNGNPLVANAGAVFSYGTGLSVTDNGTGDEDPTVGEVCVGGLAPGTYTVNETTPPSGYGGASQTNVSAVATQGTNCSSNEPTGTGIATFTNPPLSDIQVNFRDGGSGETSATISCDNTTGTSSTTPATGWDTTETNIGVHAPTIVTCVITIDP
jgi:uncharacterized repeat protein (TIGR01451 family)